MPICSSGSPSALVYRPWHHTIADCLHRLKDTEVLDAEAGWAVWQGFLQGRMHWSQVWALVVLQLWHEQYVQQATRV